MKKLWAILSATLLAATAFTMGACKNSVQYNHYANADLYEVGGATFSTEQVREVEISWLGGSVEIEQNDTGKILVAEDEGIDNDAERMRYYLEGSTLKIQYCEAGIRVVDTEKNLHVSLPSGLALEVDSVSARVTALDALELASFSLENVSGNLEAEHIHCAGEVDIDTVSGSVEIIELNAGELSIETTSGDVSISKLSAREFDEVKTTSGEISLGIQKAFAEKCSIDSSSGKVTIKLLEGLGAKISFESVSGELKTEKSKSKSGRIYTFAPKEGQGSCEFEVETTSANLIIE